jgi:hypothetical protein
MIYKLCLSHRTAAVNIRIYSKFPYKARAMAIFKNGVQKGITHFVPNLLLCCKQVYLEGVDYLYAARFDFVRPTILRRFLLQIGPKNASRITQASVGLDNQDAARFEYYSHYLVNLEFLKNLELLIVVGETWVIDWGYTPQQLAEQTFTLFRKWFRAIAKTKGSALAGPQRLTFVNARSGPHQGYVLEWPIPGRHTSNDEQQTKDVPHHILLDNWSSEYGVEWQYNEWMIFPDDTSMFYEELTFLCEQDYNEHVKMTPRMEWR